MKLHNLTQGSPEWLAYRAKHLNASDAPAMLGCSPYKTRAELLRELHTGLVPDVDIATQMRFANGHRAEALARPLAEEFIGKELFPVVGSEGRLSASFDGLTLDDSEGFEHKALNAGLRAAFAVVDASIDDDAAAGRLMPIHHRIQMEQQLLVSGATRILFMTSEWVGEDLIEEHHVWYYSDAELRAQIIAGWAQFERDLVDYAPPVEKMPAPTGRAPETLPALHVEVTGMVTASNLAEFKATALGAIRAVNRDLKTDQDFADADKSIKWCADVEERLKAAKQHILSQTASIEAVFLVMDDISAESRSVRLEIEKLATARKASIKAEMVHESIAALRQHLSELNAELAPSCLPPGAADFAGAIKGKRSFDAMREALADELAACKIEAESKARVIRTNLAAFKSQAAGREFLFPDLGTLAHKAPDDFSAVVQTRIAAHKQAEEEKKRAADEAAAKAIAAADAPPALVHAAQPALVPPQQQAPAVVASTATAADEPATLKLGDIGARLGFVLSAAFVAETLGIKAAKTDGRAVLFRESDWPRICAALQRHIANVAEAVTA